MRLSVMVTGMSEPLVDSIVLPPTRVGDGRMTSLHGLIVLLPVPLAPATLP